MLRSVGEIVCVDLPPEKTTRTLPKNIQQTKKENRRGVAPMMQLSMICKAVDPWPISNESSRRQKTIEADIIIYFSNGQWGESWVRYPKFAPSCPYYIPTIHGLYRVNEGIFLGNKLQKYSPTCTHSFSLNFGERQGNGCFFYASSTDNLFP